MRNLGWLGVRLVRALLGLRPDERLPAEMPVQDLVARAERTRVAEQSIAEQALDTSARLRARLRRAVAAREALADTSAEQFRALARLGEILGAPSPAIDDVLAAAAARRDEIEELRAALGPFATACPARNELIVESEGQAARDPAWRFSIRGLRAPLMRVDFATARRLFGLPEVEPSQESGDKGGARPGQADAHMSIHTSAQLAPLGTTDFPRPEPAPLASDDTAAPAAERSAS